MPEPTVLAQPDIELREPSHNSEDQVSGSDIVLGTHSLTTRRIGGANRVVISELTHIDAPRTWGVRGIDGPIRATIEVTVEPATETSSG